MRTYGSVPLADLIIAGLLSMHRPSSSIIYQLSSIIYQIRSGGEWQRSTSLSTPPPLARFEVEADVDADADVDVDVHEQSINRRIFHNHKDQRPLPPNLHTSTG